MKLRATRACKAFAHYIHGTGPFESYASCKDILDDEENDPMFVWQQFLGNPDVKDLAQFALLLLNISCNQGGNERVFSDLLVKKTKRRNRLKLPRLEKMSKVGAAIRAEHLAQSLVRDRAARTVHDKDRVAQLLSVPRYADVLDPDAPDSDTESPDPATSGRQPGLVLSCAAWRRELRKWKDKLLEDDDIVPPHNLGFFPRSLALLFGGTAARPATAPARGHAPRKRKQAHSMEALYMELLAAEYDGEEPDAGAVEGSDDDYEP